MKPEKSFPLYTEIADCAGEGVFDLSETIDVNGVNVGQRKNHILKDVPVAVSKRSDFDWLALFLYHLFTTFCRRDAKSYRWTDLQE